MVAFLYFFVIILCFTIHGAEHKPVDTNIRSDVVVTSGFNIKNPYYTNGATDQTMPTETDSSNEPGWMRRQLKKLGNMFGSIGNGLGGFTKRITGTLDKFCELVKTIIPVVAAVCHVGQFQFCGSVADAPKELAEALSPINIDLSIPD
ncbi:hypothetical protein PPYR_04473 [Photinus pyralis]|uniref:Uncharacterized protein n=1 Tax=Photinus pyralis TaxID=7054 RepID=A0A1Y1MEK3_PHOPY|nr:hypothetical protein PPYR_04473 [Photinus pyralis]